MSGYSFIFIHIYIILCRHFLGGEFAQADGKLYE